MQKYDVESMVTMETGESYRKKLGMYLDGDKQRAIYLGLRELVVNAQDEFSVYKPTNAELRIKLDTKKRIISVEDNLRGMPVGMRKDGVNALHAAFLLPHSGAKHEEGVYSSAIGINGQGLKVVTHTARFLEVDIWREGKHFHARFEGDDKGAHPVGEIEEEVNKINSNKTGTLITYMPDDKVYGDVFINLKDLREMLGEMALFTRGLKIFLEVDDKEIEEFFSKNGLVDSLKNKNAISKPFSYFYANDDCEVELALQWVSKRGNVKGYANGLYMPDGGPFMTGFKTTLTRKINSLSGKKFSGDRIRTCLDGIVSVKVKLGDFSNQQKSLLGNPEAREPTSKAIGECLDKFYKERVTDFDKVIELLSKLDKAEKAADKARETVLNATKEIKEIRAKMNFASEKLSDAENLGQDSILLMVEGKSAAGSMAIGRDTKKYGILELRGKVINALTHPIEKILENEEVMLIMSALGVNYNKYDSSKLRYGKVAIAVDADNDGAHIACLIMAFFHKFFPEFLKEGRLYWLRPPLYKVIKGKKSYYFYSDEELNKSGISGAQTRFKGLGEMNAEDMKVMFNKETQLLDILIYDEQSGIRIEQLMGPDVEPRKEFVYSLDFSKYTELL